MANAYGVRGKFAGQTPKEGHKFCVRCEDCLPLSRFTKIRNGKYWASACNRCNALQKYRMFPTDYDQLFIFQGGLCAICRGTGEPDRDLPLCVDHNHVTGEVRGLLCRSCNSGIGGLRDDPSIVRSAVAYLENPPCPFTRIAAPCVVLSLKDTEQSSTAITPLSAHAEP